MKPKQNDKHHGICTGCGRECTATFDSGVQVLDGPFGTMPQKVDPPTWYSDCCGKDAEAENACEGWGDEVTQICWGGIKQHVVEKSRRPVTEEDTCYANCDEFVEYELADTEA